MTAVCPACDAAPVAMALADVKGADVTLSVPDVTCAACIGKIERALTALNGIEEARVNLTLKRVTVRTRLDPERLVAALKGVGYAAYPFDIDHVKSVGDATARDLILRLGVAGFAMMNVMLLSVAVWSGATDATRDLFHLVSAAIALPCTLFSARPFFVNAWAALRVRRLNMDVPISLAIALAAGMSLYEALNGGAHAYFDAALSLTFFLLIGRVLEHQTRAAARSAAEDLTALEVRTARRKTAAGHEDVPVTDLRIGDQVQVATGMRAPVDGTLEGASALTDRAFLTGESDPVSSARGALIQAGEVNVGAPFYLRACAVGEDTALRQMARMVETAESARNRYTSLADRAAAIYAPAVHILAALTFVVWLAVTGDMRQSLNVAIATLIITCPCALGLAVPAVATAAIGRLYAMGFLVKSGTALERLAESDTVMLDKTGTLTVPGILTDLSALDAMAQRIAKGLADASQHPMSKAVARALADVDAAPIAEIVEHPGQGIEGQYGAQRVALGRADGSGLALHIGDRVIPIPTQETLRPGAQDMARALPNALIVSGDTPTKTQALADRLGLSAWRAGVSPKDKLALVHELQRNGKHVTMIGDGINDTGALAAAHASVAPGSALDAARTAADVILLRPALGDVPKLFAIARLSARLSQQNFAIAALYNAIAIPIAVLGFATPMLAALAMSASSITVLLNALRVRMVS